MPSIQVHFESVEKFQFTLGYLSAWLKKVAREFDYTIIELNYILCTDEYLLHMNQSYLHHDYYTDVITFDNSENTNQIAGDVFISKDRIIENAQTFDVPVQLEFNRVALHGLLHLCGLNDKTNAEKKIMRTKEEAYLSLLSKP